MFALGRGFIWLVSVRPSGRSLYVSDAAGGFRDQLLAFGRLFHHALHTIDKAILRLFIIGEFPACEVRGCREQSILAPCFGVIDVEP